jgi:hypothetical protein
MCPEGKQMIDGVCYLAGTCSPCGSSSDCPAVTACFGYSGESHNHCRPAIQGFPDGNPRCPYLPNGCWDFAFDRGQQMVCVKKILPTCGPDVCAGF